MSLCHKHAMQQAGAFPVPGHSIASTQQCVRQMQHHKTIRGHKLAVYCIAFDRAGRHIITGSDDRLVKIWSSQTALLLRSCRGHDGEVTDLALNMESSMVASSSNDQTIRCWSLKDHNLGHPVSVLVGHQGPVTYVDFNRTVPNVLLSSSFDGTCRIWDATNSAWPAKVMRACPSFGPMKGITRFGGLSGPFNPGQTSKPNTRSLQEPATARGMPADAANAPIEQRLRSSDPPEAAAAGADAAVNDQEAPTDQPGLLVCGFSPDGSHIVAGSNDCHIYAWFWDIASAADKGKAATKQGFYNVVSEQDAARNLEPAAAVDLQAADWPDPQEVCRLGGHVNDVLLLQFSHDGQSIATGSKDGTMRTWQRTRRRHKKLSSWENKHVLKCELDDAAVRKAKQKRRAPPVASVNQLAWSCDDMLVLSSVSDHTIRVWDAQAGVEVQRLVGHQAQVHILECHPFNHKLAMSASYDGTTKLWNLHTGQLLTSFSTQDTRPDIHTSWTDHIQLVDGHWSPDGASLVVSDVAGQWHAYSMGAPDLVKHARYDQFLESDYDRLTRDINNAVIDDNTQQPPHLRPTRDYLVDYVAGRYGEPYQSAYRSDQVMQLPLRAAQGEGEWDTLSLPQALREFPPTVTAAGWVAQEAEGTDEDIDRAIHRALQRAIAAEAALAAAVVAGEVDLTTAEHGGEEDRDVAGGAVGDDQPQEAAAGPSRGEARTRRSAPPPTDDDADMEPEGEEADEWEQWPDADVDISSSDGSAAASDSDASIYSRVGGSEGGPRTRAQRRARRRGTGKRSRADGFDLRTQRARKRRRVQESRYAEDDSDEEEDPEELEEEYLGQDGQQRLLRSHRRGARRSETRSKKQQTKRRGRRQTGRAQGGASAQGGRTLDKYAWLQVTWRTPGVYVPQLGDQVVYLQVGHHKFLSANNNKLQGPWDSIVSTAAESRGQRMREVEPAHVTALTYVISNDGARDTCARLTLRLSDPRSPLQGRTFDVELPPATNGHAEFVIPQHRFLASVHRMWKRGDRCQVFYPDADDVTAAAATCDPWHGLVADIGSHDDQAQDSMGEEPGEGDGEVHGEQAVQADPYGCGGLWERFLVLWQPNTQAQAHQANGEDDASEPSRMCPWELFEEGLDSQQAAAEGPALEATLADSLLHAMQTLAASHHFAAFHDLLLPHQSYPASDTGVPMFYNTLVALPMSLSLMKERLQQGYYRQLEGWLGDVATLESNARAFCGDDSPVTEAAADLARRLRAAAEGLDYQEDLSDEDDEEGDTDAEISEMEEDVDAYPPATFAEDGKLSPPEKALEDARGVMNSPEGHPWGAEARRSRRSSRRQRQHAPPIASDSTAVLRDPEAGPYRSRLRSRIHTGAAASDEPASSSMHNAHAAKDTAEHQAAADAPGPARQTRSLRSREQGGSHGSLPPWGAAPSLNGAASGSAHAFSGDGTWDGGASTLQRRDEQHQQQQQQVSGGRALRSRRGQAPRPDEAQLQSDDDAQLAQALQESMLSGPPVRRSGRNSRAAGAQQAGDQGRSEEPVGASHAGPSHAGPSAAAEQMSPGSSRETRAQQRASRAQQMHVHETSPEPADAQTAEPEGQFVRRSQRQQTRASSASVEASQRAVAAAQRDDTHLQRPDAPQDSLDDSDTKARGPVRQGTSGIKLTLRRTSNAIRQRDEDSADADAPNRVRTATGLRVSLRPRRS
ncbi:hypothetical protein ABBQ38_005065 [Trebouxia sp. C0009 RCD-2024]